MHYCGESGRREVMSRKFSQGKAGGWVLSPAGGRASSCHCTFHPPVTGFPSSLATGNHGWINWWYFLQWEKWLNIGSSSPLTNATCCILRGLHFTSSVSVGRSTAMMVLPQIHPRIRYPPPRFPFCLCLWPAGPLPSRYLPCTHLCARFGGRLHFLRLAHVLWPAELVETHAERCLSHLS